MPAIRELLAPMYQDHPVEIREGLIVTFRFDRMKINDEWILHWTQLEEAQSTGAINEVLGDLIEDWDVFENDEATKVPPTAENVGRYFNLETKGRIVRELMMAAPPSRAEGKASSAPSSTPPLGSTAPPLTSPNGPMTLPSPAPSTSPSLT